LTDIIFRIIIIISTRITSCRRFLMPTRTVRTTFALPVELLAAVDQAIQAGHARSRNELVAMALRRELAAQQRAAIDAAFAAMAEDAAYQSEAQEIAAAFAQADWEALRLTEGPA
jgi:metal-responsive CopG/Arc/MetJ family transcriptional regulator